MLTTYFNKYIQHNIRHILRQPWIMSASMESMEVIPSINVEELINEALKISQVKYSLYLFN